MLQRLVSFSYNIMYAPVKKISYMFNSVLYPTFSKLKDEKKILSIYFKSIYLVSLVTFPIMVIISFNADYIILNIFGNKWNGAIPIVRVLSIAGAFQSITLIGSAIFQVLVSLKLFIPFIL